MTAIILAGGKSSRMGSDKAFTKFEGLSLISRQLEILKRIFKKIIIVTNSPDRYKLKDARIISDTIPNCGPLSGIYSGLLVSSSLYNFVIACDMPFINLKLIKYMWNLKNGFDIIVPQFKKGFEPLFAIYSKNCISHIYDILHSDNFRIIKLFDKIRLREISEEEVSKFGDPKTLFMNINAKKDLVIVRKIRQDK